MKTKEFVEKVENLKFKVDKNGGSIFIRDIEDNTVLEIYLKEKLMIHVTYNFSSIISNEVKEELFDLAVEYTKTPIDEREEPKKYFWKLKGKWSDNLYIVTLLNGEITLSDIIFYENSRTKLTEEEFEEICEKFDLVKDVFEKEEVE